jgi:hypothetical protein
VYGDKKSDILVGVFSLILWLVTSYIIHHACSAAVLAVGAVCLGNQMFVKVRSAEGLTNNSDNYVTEYSGHHCSLYVKMI